ncbi:MAG: IclR family transcriptional regulator [Bryobacterales bacterium]|nr:IclR family transcriptional regulator [Bryobacterales bacterium]
MVNLKSAVLNNYEVGAVRKALEILCQFNVRTPSLTVSELSRRLEMPKSTTHNLLRTLQALDFLQQAPADKRYSLGPRVFELGLLFSHHTRLVSLALPHLRRLADQTRETVKLGILSGGEVLILAAQESPYQLHTRGDEGMRAPCHCTGLGKAILSTLPAGEVGRIAAARGLRRFTPHTHTSLRRLERDLVLVRERGYALDLEEHEAGVTCVAAGIAGPGHAIYAALSVSAPSSRLTDEQTAVYGKLAAQSARAISAALNNSSGAAPPLRSHR